MGQYTHSRTVGERGRFLYVSYLQEHSLSRKCLCTRGFMFVVSLIIIKYAGSLARVQPNVGQVSDFCQTGHQSMRRLVRGGGNESPLGA